MANTTDFKWPQSIHEFGVFLKKQKLLYAGAEVGVAEGRFSLTLMGWGVKKLFLIDIWKHTPNVTGDANSPQSWHDSNYFDAKERMKPFGNKVKFLKGESNKMVEKVKDDSLAFVYLDGNHSYEGVKEDLKLWLPKIKKGGVMIGHDYNHLYGVLRAVNEFAGEHVKVLPEQSIENQGFWFYADDVR